MMENTDASIGRILKERREELGYTLQAAEEATRIRKTYLDSLENNRFSELPGQAYVTGFIRIYARYLGLKSNPLLALLNDLQSVATKPEETIQTARPLPDLRAGSSSGGDWRKFFLIFILILVLGCLVYFMPVMFSGDEQTNHNTTKITESVGSRVEPGKTQAELAESQAEAEEPQANAAAQAPVPPRVVAKQQTPDNRALPVIPYNGALLRMLALADSSLIIKVDGREADQYKLYDGLDLTWQIKQKVNVEFDASDVARFWLNGQEIDITGYESFELNPAVE
jgi:cytoskeletal protein RodZ